MLRQLAKRITSCTLGAGRVFLTVVIAAACWAVSNLGHAAQSGSDEVTLYLGANFAGPSRTWALQPNTPFVAIPYTGDDFRPSAGSIKLGADVGVLLFETPFFSSVDRTCDYELGATGEPQRWWLSEATTVVPGPDEGGEVERNLQTRSIASLILYQRELGPPPGALLLERRRYINWDCPAPTKARAYKRLFIPAAAPPHRQGCYNLDTALSYGPAGEVSLDFLATSELLLMAPRDLTDDYVHVDHALTVSLYDQAECKGTSASFVHAKGEARQLELKDFAFDRKARSVMIRYDQGAYDDMLDPPDQQSETPVETIAEAAPQPVAEEVQEPPDQSPAASAPEPVPEESVAVSAEDTKTTGTTDALAGAKAATEAESASDEPANVGWITGDTVALEPAAETPDESSDPEPAGSAAVASETAAETLVTASPGQRVEQASVGSGAVEAAPDEYLDPSPGEPPEAETGFLSLPESDPGAGAAGQTFKFPLLEGYRLSACLYARQDCGEPAAREWCKAKGFAGGATSWKIDENIGSLFPTLAFGDLRLCASFICDGFQEITCTP